MCPDWKEASGYISLLWGRQGCEGPALLDQSPFPVPLLSQDPAFSPRSSGGAMAPVWTQPAGPRLQAPVRSARPHTHMYTRTHTDTHAVSLSHPHLPLHPHPLAGVGGQYTFSLPCK